MSIFNHLLLGLAIHYTGGILSPFIFVFFFILVSDTANASNYFPSYLACLLVYFGVVGAEYFGAMEPVYISTEEIYSSPFGTLLVSSSVVVFLTIVGQAYKRIVQELRANLQKELEQKERARHELSKMDAASQIGLVVHKIVHDLRGPLGAIGGFIHVIKRENKLTKESNQDCEMMLEELSRITALLNRLIAYVKPGQMQRDRICPIETLETVLSVISFYPGAHRIRFERDFSAPNDCAVYATKEEMQQVLFNLLKNAIEAVEHSPTRSIKCRVYSEPTAAVIEIADSGPGIPSEVLAHLWEGNVTTKKEGAGLGLRIVKEILDAYDGQINVLSELGNGARVTVRLPRYEEAMKTRVAKGA
jgi:signal transduction histidine kinase